MRDRIARWPVWVRILCTVILLLTVRAVAESLAGGGSATAEDGTPRLAFWQFIAVAVSWVWRGIEVITAATVQALQISVTLLWGSIRVIWNGIRDVGSTLARGLRAGWDLLRLTYENVLKPAWQKFWTWFDRARKWLEDILRPVFRWLNRVRAWLLELYDKWLRPVLDVIALIRRGLRVLAALGLEWARELDRVLADVERRIDGAFRQVLSKINEVVNIVNRVVTADGLFQRVALLRSIERDFSILRAQFWEKQSRELEDWERRRLKLPEITKTPEEHATEFERLIVFDDGRRKDFVEEVITDFRRLLNQRSPLP